jgi:hypothetical protein
MRDFIEEVFLLLMKICAIKILNSVEKTPLFVFTASIPASYVSEHKKMQCHRFVGYRFIQGNAVIVCFYIRLLKLTIQWGCEFVSCRSSGDELSILLGYDATSVGVWFEIFQYSVVVSKQGN